MKLVILDRDGVINRDSDNFIKSVDEWQPLSGSLEAIAALKQAGYTVMVATNQSGIARGLYSEQVLGQMHEKMQNLLGQMGVAVDGVYYCPHGPNDECECRKPKAGMYRQIAENLNTSLKNVPVIGDSWRDLEAAISVKARPMLVRTGKGLRTLQANEKELKRHGVLVYDDLAAAVASLLAE